MLRHKQHKLSAQSVKRTRPHPNNNQNQSHPQAQFSNHTIGTSRTHSKVTIVNRLPTEPQKQEGSAIPFQSDWQFLYNRRESYLNSMFNRRKTVLESISRKNRDIYARIMNQESQYSKEKLNKGDSTEKNKLTIENLTANSRILLTLSKHALANSNATPHKLRPIKDIQNNDKIVENAENNQNLHQMRVFSKNLQPIMEKGNTLGGEIKVLQSRYIRQHPKQLKEVNRVLANFNRTSTSTQLRSNSCRNSKISDIYTNF